MKQFLPEGQLNPTSRNTNNIGGAFFMSNSDNEFAQGSDKKRPSGFRKHHQMSLRNRKLNFDKENFIKL
jgi:hypothetical protein